MMAPGNSCLICPHPGPLPKGEGTLVMDFEYYMPSARLLSMLGGGR